MLNTTKYNNWRKQTGFVEFEVFAVGLRRILSSGM
jgi:hypothetical protein